MVDPSFTRSILLVVLVLLFSVISTGAQDGYDCSGTLSWIGDGVCDGSNNNPECGYDGGDCCPCTCTDIYFSFCETSFDKFVCIDPDSGCAIPSPAAEYANCTGIISFIGDGICDRDNNVEECGFDDGDCCACTCVDTEYYSCGEDEEFICVDPDSGCTDPVAVEYAANCTDGTIKTIGDGRCDHETNNNEACGFDGGDCCECTCVDGPEHSCGDNKFDCLDHSAPLAMYGCEELPPPAPPCPTNSQHDFLVVQDTTQADALADRIYCSGGVFQVEWSGEVVVTRTIYVVNGTVLKIMGMDSGAIVSGGGTIQPFVVVNASFHLSNLAVLGGSATSGGAVAAFHSSLNFDEIDFIGNSASKNGGAFYASGGSEVFFWGKTSAVNNTAASGGALHVTSDSRAAWTGETLFSGNRATKYGGALFISHFSAVVWAGDTAFTANTADQEGGAMDVWNGSVSWTGGMTFSGNTAGTRGGAINMWSDSEVIWNASTAFITNAAGSEGGALFIGTDSSAAWVGDTVFSKNTADYGGAIFLRNAATMTCGGQTYFTFNSAVFDGGAVGSSGMLDGSSSFSASTSDFFINGPTTFRNNSCGGNGGALAMMGMLLVWAEPRRVTFTGNLADVAGGAVFVSDTNNGPEFIGANFSWNSAKVGGVFYATSSGVHSGLHSFSSTPRKFVECDFVGNNAFTSGGAVESASGHDEFVKSRFVGNSAGLGGALRLSGTASIDRCSFVDNVSGVGGGPAVSSIGSTSIVNGSSFFGNLFSCEPVEYVTVEESSEVFETVCDGCHGPCDGCFFDEPPVVPKRCILMSEVGVRHASSDGGILETLNINPGYWRATNTSTKVLECHNKKACRGGITGASDFCSRGYEGPYCSVCSKDFTATAGFRCTACTDSQERWGIAMAAAAAVVGVVGAVTIFFYLVSREMHGTGRGLVDQVARRVPLQSVKIIIVAGQIVTQFSFLASVSYPSLYQSVVNALNFFNFDITRAFSAGCFIDNVDFHLRLLITTIGPLGVIGLLGITYTVAVRRNRGSKEALRNVWHKHVSTALLVTFLVYSNVSSVLMQTFATEDLDDGHTYLTSDYSINVDSNLHTGVQVFAGSMFVLYVIGIPGLYAFLLFKKRDVLQNKSRREHDLRVTSTASLWKPYKTSRYFYEVVECIRRIMLTGMVPLIKGDTAARIAATLMVALLFVFVSEILNPYESSFDAWVSRAGHAVVFISMYFALLLKVDVSDEDTFSRKTFEVILIMTHACMVLAVIIESVLMSYAFKIEELPRENPIPDAKHGKKKFYWSADVFLVEVAGKHRSAVL